MSVTMEAMTREEIRQVNLPSSAALLWKRIFDIFCAVLGLAVLSPVFLVTALLVGCTSPGGILFRQERMGRNGAAFTIYKFRTMQQDNGGLKITAGNDCRITSVGRFLRKSKLDELPQLWNVLKGDMSFVGPRPEVREYTDLYDANQRQIFLLRPGITGLASIAFRNENELLAGSDDPNRSYIEEIMPRKLTLDLAYIPKASVGYDIQLILRTLAAVIQE